MLCVVVVSVSAVPAGLRGGCSSCTVLHTLLLKSAKCRFESDWGHHMCEMGYSPAGATSCVLQYSTNASKSFSFCSAYSYAQDTMALDSALPLPT